MNIIWVALGGALGALARHGLAKGLQGWNPHPGFSAGILCANLAGCFLMGLVMVWVGQLSETYKEVAVAFLLTGLLGSLTTFSTFILEVYQLAQSGGAKIVAGHLAAHLLIGLFGLWAGFQAAQRLSL